jgi:23S rRNA pseudouridine1911/1915/1917 synthase
VAEGAVQLNGAVCTGRAERLTEGDELAVAADALEGHRRAGFPQADDDVHVPVVHEDADVVVVDKPAGLVVHPGAGNTGGTLCAGLLARYPEMAAVGDPARPGIVHRLDAGTSGLLVVARTAVAYESLVAQLAERTVQRCYEAVCWGEVSEDRGIIDAPVGRSGRRPTRMTVTERGRPARTSYEVRRRYRSPAPVTHVVCRLETGRTHQIRVHLAAIGHPVVGDDAYGGRARPETPDAAPPGLGPGRPALHAALLGFRHPGDERSVEFASPLPGDMAELVDGLS